jgi:hypothetical protein
MSQPSLPNSGDMVDIDVKPHHLAVEYSITAAADKSRLPAQRGSSFRQGDCRSFEGNGHRIESGRDGQYRVNRPSKEPKDFFGFSNE